MHHKGEGVPQDYKEAVKWFTKAAEQGDRDDKKKLHTTPRKTSWLVKKWQLSWWLQQGSALRCKNP
jgi:TPR repeat protein